MPAISYTSAWLTKTLLLLGKHATAVIGPNTLCSLRHISNYVSSHYSPLSSVPDEEGCHQKADELHLPAGCPLPAGVSPVRCRTAGRGKENQLAARQLVKTRSEIVFCSSSSSSSATAAIQLNIADKHPTQESGEQHSYVAKHGG
jgi:hypothetical protein